jgi:hypothetical protein
MVKHGSSDTIEESIGSVKTKAHENNHANLDSNHRLANGISVKNLNPETAMDNKM